MDPSIIISFINNAALLLALALLYDTLGLRPGWEYSPSKKIITGLALGSLGIAIMFNPWHFGHGIMFDTRSVLLCISGFFFGTVPVVMAGLMTSALRVFTGGSGVLTGVAVIVTSGGIGLAWRNFRPNPQKNPSIKELYLLGLAVHAAMLLCTFFLSRETAFDVLSVIALPVMLIYPVVTALLGNLITGRQMRSQVARALEKSEEKFRNIFQYHSAAKLLIEADTGRIAEANQAAAEFYGWRIDELKNLKIQEINTLPEERVKAEMKSAMARKSNYFEFRHCLSNGSVRDVEVYSSRIDINGNEYLYSVIHDVTGRKQTEAALRESEENQRAMIEASPFAIITITPDGLVKSWNAAAERIFGWTETEVTGKFLPIVPKDHEEDFADMRRRVMAGEALSRIELTRVRKDGTPIEVSLSTAPTRDKNGKNTGILSILEDITERRKAEKEQERLQAQVLQAQKMESVGRLAGGVAHDYNNMLGVILGYTELALEKLEHEDSHGLREDLDEVLSAARRSADITRQLLAFSRQQAIAPESLDLNETVENMLRMLRRLIGENIDLLWQPRARKWKVCMDPSQVDQILVNLCVNARDAITDVGEITIETETRTFDEDYCSANPGFVPGDYVMLSVSDNGCGMGKETQNRLFEPFFTTKKTGEGTGLGLATVYGIVKQNDGFINVYSEPGNGTTFRIYLPKHETIPEEAKSQVFLEPEMKGTETVLLVEDERQILHMTTMMLEKLGYTVLPAQTAAEAMDTARAHTSKIDLLMTDVVMPDMNGRELSENIKSLYPGVKVMFMSGYTANLITHRGVLDEGMNFIQKPFSRRDLAVKLREILDEDGQ